mmetsp:Transcript_86726/g.245508  ORF Transcript_86726/g.245508 Transcript_86726/m.245508 type:complete len:95 (-) Transcript_86726:180-464(-)
MSMCHLKLKQPRKVVENCNKILAVKDDHVKAIFNLGKAYVQMNDLDKAKKNLTDAARMSPNDVAINKELAKLPALLQKQKKKEGDMWKSAFKQM